MIFADPLLSGFWRTAHYMRFFLCLSHIVIQMSCCETCERSLRILISALYPHSNAALCDGTFDGQKLQFHRLRVNTSAKTDSLTTNR